VVELHRDNTLRSRLYPLPCDSFTINIPVAEGIPACLYPTHLQQNVPHSPWINVIPFPKLRDNLIRRHDDFDHNEYVRDMLGALEEGQRPAGPLSYSTWTGGNVGVSSDMGDEDGSTGGWGGAIICGEPYVKESWEFTLPFLRKWAWTLDGCEEVIEVSNRWRQCRGISPLEPL
jgi:hypothetical protein